MAGEENPDDESEQEEWRFSVDEVGETTESQEETEDGNVAGTLVHEQPLEPESISLENAVFFLVGALGTILFIVLAVSGL